MSDDQNKQPPNDDYLWDGSGNPDPEVQRLENLLGRFRSNAPAPEFRPNLAPDLSNTAPRRAQILPMRTVLARWIPLAAAAAIILAVGAGILLHKPQQSPISQSRWQVAWLSGTPLVGGQEIGGSTKNVSLGVGEDLVTGAGSRAAIQDADTGQIEVEPESRVRLLESRPGRNHIALARGTIHVRIWAPPGEFVVDTPSAVAVDLGCSYTLETDESGSGLLRTTLGWVGFERNGRESFIPAGAACPMHANTGPGTPYFDDASPTFRAALYQLDLDASAPKERDVDLAIVLAESRKRDALSLWHLLSRASDSQRTHVYDRLAALLPPPSGVSRESVMRLDPKSLDLWWNELGVGDIELWRHWERTWPQPKSSSR
jgi:hypothetical protein